MDCKAPWVAQQCYSVISLMEILMEQQDVSLTSQLDDFFRQWPQFAMSAPKPRHINLRPESLQAFFADLEQPLIALRHRAFSFDPWDIAGVGRNEMRNSTLLAWLLDPSGNHGFGMRPLTALLSAVAAWRKEAFPVDTGRYCQVEVETSPTGDSSNRVDIEINAEKFFLLIEVKIGAVEQKDQLARYCKEAQIRAGQRDWAVVFLTPQGREPLTRGGVFKREDVPCISWSRLAADIMISVENIHRGVCLRTDISPSRQMASWSALCFIERMRRL